MKRLTLILLAVVIQIGIANAQTEEKVDSSEVKTGFTFGALPAIAYDSDLGFRYGALTNLYWYGDGSQYPDYRHSLYAEWSRTTKGSGNNTIKYDSDYLIPKVRMQLEASLFTEKSLDFYGFNGAKSVFNTDFIADENHDDYLSRVYYRLDRKWLMLKSDFWGDIKGKELRWYAGLQFNKVDIAGINIENINDGLGVDEEGYLDPAEELLYDKYINWGIIKENQKDGGNNTQIKLGLVYDTRDEEPNPTSGMWTEAFFMYAADMSGNDLSYSNLIVTHRHYFPIVKERLSAAIRLTYQGKLSGETPFYMMPFYYSTFQTKDGLGGSKTVRGILRDRVVGESVGLTNIELRWKFFKGKFLGQNLYLALSGFLDGGMVLKEYDFDLTKVKADGDEYALNFTTESERLHMAAGVGFHFVMNRNFIVAIDYGKALDPQDGSSGLYIGLNFLY